MAAAFLPVYTILQLTAVFSLNVLCAHGLRDWYFAATFLLYSTLCSSYFISDNFENIELE